MDFADAVKVSRDKFTSLEFGYRGFNRTEWFAQIELTDEAADELLANLAAKRQVRQAEEARKRKENSRVA